MSMHDDAPPPGGGAVAIAIEDTATPKLGVVSVTWVSQHSCDQEDCPFLDSGCYGEYGPAGFVTRRLNLSEERDPVRIARAEAAAIDTLTGDRPLRLHVVGDSRTARAARIVAAASARYKVRGRRCRGRGSDVWTYTHSWRKVPRSAWGSVSVLASCESPDQAIEAMDQGYAAALVVDRFRGHAAYDLGGVRVIPCPWQTRKITCRECQLCWHDDRLLERRLVIGFEAHGTGAPLVRLSLPLVD